MARLAPLLIACAAALAVPPQAAAAPFREAHVRAELEAAGFGDIAKRAAAASRATVLIRRTRAAVPRRLGTSRLGGPADLPAGEPWPQCKGQPQSFLGQVRVRDLPRSARALRRHGGRLLVFTHVEFEDPAETRFGLWAGDCTAVIHARRGAALERTAPPKRTMRLRPANVRYRAVPSLPDADLGLERLNRPLRNVSLEGDAVERWWELAHRLQGEPRHEHRLLGHVATPNGGDRCFARTQRREGRWRHLLTIGSDFGVRFEVADAGRLQVALPPGDLRRGRFDRVCGIFDSA